MFTEGGKIWGVNVSSPSNKVQLDTLAAGESIAAGASDGSSNFVAINSASGSRLLGISSNLVKTSLGSVSGAVQQLALTPTRVVVVRSAGYPNVAVESWLKTGGSSTSLASTAGLVFYGVIVSGENVYVPETTSAGSVVSQSVYVVSADGTNAATWVNTILIQGIAPQTFGLAGNSTGNSYAVLIADGVTGLSGLTGASLRSVDGATRVALKTYGAFLHDGSPLPFLTPDPVQWGQPGLLTIGNATQNDLYYFSSSAAGLVPVP
jgi:hypothetical protein